MSESLDIDFERLRVGNVVMDYGREYRVVQKFQTGERIGLLFETVEPIEVSDLDIHNGALDRMWRASKSFNGGQV